MFQSCKVLCTVAPYEADAQLAYLCREGYVDAVIAEDSDTVPYGCKEVRQQTAVKRSLFSSALVLFIRLNID
jgi:5'-3' exonuclease